MLPAPVVHLGFNDGAVFQVPVVVKGFFKNGWLLAGGLQAYLRCTDLGFIGMAVDRKAGGTVIKEILGILDGLLLHTDKHIFDREGLFILLRSGGKGNELLVPSILYHVVKDIGGGNNGIALGREALNDGICHHYVGVVACQLTVQKAMIISCNDDCPTNGYNKHNRNTIEPFCKPFEGKKYPIEGKQKNCNQQNAYYKPKAVSRNQLWQTKVRRRINYNQKE